MLKIDFKRLWLFCIICIVTVTHSYAKMDTLVYRGGISLYKMGGGLKNRKSIVQGTNLAPTDSASIRIYADFIQKEDAGYNNALLYEIHLKAGSSEDEWKVSTSSYDVKNNALGEMGTYYRAAELSKLSKYSTIINNWGSDNIISSVKGAYECYTEHELLSGLDKNKQLIHNKRLSQLSSVPVKIEIILPSGVNLAYVKIPVLGELYDDGKISKWIKFDPKHKIGDKDHDWSDDIYYDLKTPPLEEGAVDLRLASHRGFWGYDLGNGPIENTEPSIKAAKKYTNIIESDISITKDSVIVVSHDYNLQRLTDYNVPNYKGKTPENTFIYDLTMPELKKFDLHLKKRNSAVDKNFQLITLEALLEYMEENKTALHLDVKERAQRRDPITGDCTAACDVNRNKRDTAWVALLRKIIEVTDSAEAWDHVTVKTTLPPSKIVSLLGRKNINKLRKIHFLPVIHPGANLDNAINFINEWYNNAPTLIAGFETSFKTLSEPVMNPFIKNGKTYQNIFHYIISETGLRPGLYSEEPMGPKGVVDRYAQWMFKDLSKDFRGDPFFLMDVPYYGTSIITTDRPDIWKAIGDIYKNPTLTHSMSSNNSSESDATNDATIIDHSAISKINARYESGTIIINGLDKIDIGSNIALFNPQGGLIYQSRITTEPQMVIPASIPFGVCILRISGNRSESFKLLINN